MYAPRELTCMTHCKSASVSIFTEKPLQRASTSEREALGPPAATATAPVDPLLGVSPVELLPWRPRARFWAVCVVEAISAVNWARVSSASFLQEQSA